MAAALLPVTGSGLRAFLTARLLGAGQFSQELAELLFRQLINAAECLLPSGGFRDVRRRREWTRPEASQAPSG